MSSTAGNKLGKGITKGWPGLDGSDWDTLMRARPWDVSLHAPMHGMHCACMHSHKAFAHMHPHMACTAPGCILEAARV
eukprot:365664-Chlamydomonas_euryale.AAC.18